MDLGPPGSFKWIWPARMRAGLGGRMRPPTGRCMHRPEQHTNELQLGGSQPQQLDQLAPGVERVRDWATAVEGECGAKLAIDLCEERRSGQGGRRIERRQAPEAMGIADRCLTERHLGRASRIGSDPACRPQQLLVVRLCCQEVQRDSHNQQNDIASRITSQVLLLVMSKQAPGTLELVRSFVNTVHLEREEESLPDPAALTSWLVEHGLADRGVHATASDLRRAVGLREALRDLLLAHTSGTSGPSSAVQTLNAVSDRARLRLRFQAPGSASLEPERSGVDGALGRLVAIVHDAIAEGTWQRLKACRLESCEWAFYDHTKNHSGAWCSMDTCGNRAKARAYRERWAAG